MSSYKDVLKAFAVQLFEINAVKFGEFKTKVGLMTPVYCDLRVIISYPHVMKSLTDLLVQHLKNSEQVDLLCGVPYTALPIATAVSLKTGLPMVMRRQEAKSHGTKKKVEGAFKTGDKCLVVEDVVTSGSSIMETVDDLRNEGLKCKDAIVFLNREQGGAKILEENGIRMHAVLTLSELIEFLVEAKCIDQQMQKKVLQYIEANQVTKSILNKGPTQNRLKMSFLDRGKQTKNPSAAKLFDIMATKETTLCLAADLTDSTKLLNLAEQVGPYICALKTHIDIVDNFNESFIDALKDIAQRHNFLLFEDRKFADIGHTVELQYSKGVYNISSWASLITAHSLMGKGVLDAVKKAPGIQDRGVFLLAEASASGSLITNSYTKATVALAEEYGDLVAGIVCQSPLFLENPGLIQLTPGVKIGETADELGQQYRTPKVVVGENGADVAVVGRGITESSDPVTAAKNYKDKLWQAYVERIA